MIKPSEVKVDSFKHGVMKQFTATHLPTGLTVHGGTFEGAMRALDAAVASAGWVEDSEEELLDVIRFGVGSAGVTLVDYDVDLIARSVLDALKSQ